MEEEEEPKEGEEPKEEVTSVVFLNVGLLVLYFFKFVTNTKWVCFCMSYQGEKKKVKKTKTEKYWDWELANETKPIWVSLGYIYFFWC